MNWDIRAVVESMFRFPVITTRNDGLQFAVSQEVEELEELAPRALFLNDHSIAEPE